MIEERRETESALSWLPVGIGDCSSLLLLTPRLRMTLTLGAEKVPIFRSPKIGRDQPWQPHRSFPVGIIHRETYCFAASDPQPATFGIHVSSSFHSIMLNSLEC